MTKKPVYSRIHYKKTGSKNLIRSKMYESAADGKKYSVSLYLDELEYYVFEAPCGPMVNGGKARSLSGLKKAVKAALTYFGVIFIS